MDKIMEDEAGPTGHLTDGQLKGGSLKHNLGLAFAYHEVKDAELIKKVTLDFTVDPSVSHQRFLWPRVSDGPHHLHAPLAAAWHLLRCPG